MICKFELNSINNSCLLILKKNYLFEVGKQEYNFLYTP